MIDLDENGVVIPQDYTIYVKPSELEISQRKMDGYKKLAEIKQWGIRNPVKFMNFLYGIDLLDEQAYIMQMSWNKPYVLWLASRASGKQISLDTRIPTPQGDVQLRDLHVGDTIFDKDGNPTKITYMSPIKLPEECYDVKFDDGEVIKADAEHNWYVWRMSSHCYKVMTTKEMLKDYKCERTRKPATDGYNRKSTFNEYQYRVDMCKPLEYPKRDLRIDPYVFGLWLGNGAIGTSSIIVPTDDLNEIIKNINSRGYITNIVKKRTNERTSKIVIHNSDNTPLITLLKQLGERKKKYIPDDYQYSCIEDRLALLQGIMDADGYIDKNAGSCDLIESKSDTRLIEGISKLLDSFGIKHQVKDNVRGKDSPSKRIYFITSIPCFKLKRKAQYIKSDIPKQATKKSIVSITPCDPVPMRCLQVDASSHCFLCGNRNTITHNTTMLALYYMTKTILFPSFKGIICSGTAAQSIETFRKIEDIAKKNISSFTGLNDVFINELVQGGNAGPFIHNPMGFTFQLYNGSSIKTINSSVDTQRGKRANCCVFDECGWLSEEVLQVIGAYTSNNSSFKLGGDNNIAALPKEIPNQLIYASSASSVDTPLYNRYRDFSKRMILGDDRYFVADISCDVVINATYHGKLYPASLLTQETVDNELRQNPQKAQREYYNVFQEEGNANQIIKRAQIAKNSFTYPPILYNDTNERHFVFCYDPARTTDNSTLLVGELFEDPQKGIMGRICNDINFADLATRRKTPMRLPEQVNEIHKLLLCYNGNAPEYDNVEFYMDGGSGGGGTLIPDELMGDFYDEGHLGDPKYWHPGIIDPEYSKEYLSKFPSARRMFHVLPPTVYKTLMYESLIQAVQNDLIIFPEDYDHHGYLNLMDVDEKTLKQAREAMLAKGLSDDEIANEMSRLDVAKTRVYKLSLDEEVALSQIDMMKEEIVNICRFKTEGAKDRFALPPHKDADNAMSHSDSTFHDDRAYTLAMFGYVVMQARTNDRISRQVRKETNIVSKLPSSMKKTKSFKVLG